MSLAPMTFMIRRSSMVKVKNSRENREARWWGKEYSVTDESLQAVECKSLHISNSQLLKIQEN